MEKRYGKIMALERVGKEKEKEKEKSLHPPPPPILGLDDNNATPSINCRSPHYA